MLVVAQQMLRSRVLLAMIRATSTLRELLQVVSFEIEGLPRCRAGRACRSIFGTYLLSWGRRRVLCSRVIVTMPLPGIWHGQRGAVVPFPGWGHGKHLAETP